jgi:hypothetical protein
VAPKPKNEVNHECVYVGEHDGTALEPVEQIPVAPSADLARSVALSILGGDRGSYRPSDHLRARMSERNFDIFDVEYAVRNGRCIENGEYYVEFKSHKYVFRCDIDGVGFDAALALSAEYDLIKSPLMILITGCWKTKTGRRMQRY